MGVNPKEVSFDLSSVFVPKKISQFLTDVSVIDDVSKRLAKLNDYVGELEDELRKIDAFKRELPLCMLLLNDAIGRLKEEAVQWKGRDVKPTMEEFIPLKSNSDEDLGAKRSTDMSDKKNWMSSAQLWSTPVEYETVDITKQDSVFPLKVDLSLKEEDVSRGIGENHQQACSFKKRAGAFVPFKKQHEGSVREEKVALPSEGLSLSIPVAEVCSLDPNLKGNSRSGGNGLCHSRRQQQQQQQQHLQQRKQRRCWSPDLHRRFVDALQQLGGAQVATPKQIRDLMHVDGLTNDEVKSHLQKYRLHVRRLPTSFDAPSKGNWMTADEAGELSKANAGQLASPEGPLHLISSAKGFSNTCGDSMEDEEDDKSEIHSWNGGHP